MYNYYYNNNINICALQKKKETANPRILVAVVFLRFNLILLRVLTGKTLLCIIYYYYVP